MFVKFVKKFFRGNIILYQENRMYIKWKGWKVWTSNLRKICLETCDKILISNSEKEGGSREIDADIVHPQLNAANVRQ